MEKYKIGAHVIFVDTHGVPRDALVTTWWGAAEEQLKAYGIPGTNLVYVNPDERCNDGYGRQTVHTTSVVHKSKQPAAGNYWCWPDELEM
jgi:hypothetical protein